MTFLLKDYYEKKRCKNEKGAVNKSHGYTLGSMKS
jgi:hypothetical protein